MKQKLIEQMGLENLAPMSDDQLIVVVGGSRAGDALRKIGDSISKAVEVLKALLSGVNDNCICVTTNEQDCES